MLGDISVEDVMFRHGGRSPVFDRLTLTIPRGQIVGIVGESGSGKSTLAALLQRIYPIEAGRIRIGSHDIRHVTHETLRRVIAVVPQQIQLFGGTVLENIAVGVSAPDVDRVLNVCGALGMTEFIGELPHGFHTVLAEGGSDLSGGQRQRLALARALYRDPEYLVLDEVTAALDSVAEQYVQAVVRELRANGKTVIVIAHRLSTIASADQIMVLESGSVAEQGTHSQLLARSGSYHRMWSAQVVPTNREGNTTQLKGIPSAAIPDAVSACIAAR